MPRAPSLRHLELGGPPAAWAALGFVVEGSRCRIGDVELVLAEGEAGIRAWCFASDGSAEELDGLSTRWTTEAAAEPAPPHPNGATRLDHMVVLTDGLERTTAALAAGAGLEVRRIREAGEGVRQAFLWLGDRQLLLEVVESPEAPTARASFWGLTVVVDDLDAAAEHLGPALSPPRAAVQPGRRIATVRSEAGLGVPLALMTPHRPGSG